MRRLTLSQDLQLVAAAIAILWLGSSDALAPSAMAASFRPLGYMPDAIRRQSAIGTFQGVSADGKAVAISAGSPRTWYYEPARWTTNSGFETVLPEDMAEFHGLAAGISADGRTVIGATGSLWGHGFVWTEDVGYRRLFEPNDDIYETRPSSVSNHGDVVLGTIRSQSRGIGTFRWTPSQGGVFISDLIGPTASAGAVTPDGQMIVGSIATLDNSGFEAIRWTDAGGVDRIGELPGGSVSAWANVVSANGKMVLGASSSTNSGVDGTEAFRWIEGQEMIGLGDLPGGKFQSLPTAASADGSTVVGYSHVGSAILEREEEAFIWDESHGMRSLRSVLINDFGLGEHLTYWHLSRATGISADGMTIVGYGIGPTYLWETGYNSWMINLRSCPGDTNYDCIVDISDLNNVRNLFGSRGPADTNGDAVVNIHDLNAVRNNFGASVSAQSVPEPTTGALLAIAAATLTCTTRRSIWRRRQVN